MGEEIGVDDEVGGAGGGGLEGGVGAGEEFDFSFFRFGVEAFDVAFGAGGVGGLGVDEGEVVGADDFPGEGAEFAFGGDEGAEDDDAVLEEEFGGFGGAADVFAAGEVAESEIGIETGTEVVAIEHGDEASCFGEFFFEGEGEGGFAGAGESVEPEDMGFLVEEGFFGGTGDEAVGSEHGGKEGRG